jgi:hypothetical protein
MSRLTFRDLQHATIVAKLQARRAKATQPVDPAPPMPVDPVQPEPIDMMRLIHKTIKERST